ncbi:MAG: hypothetical protein R3287_02655 [Anderseniella sp.]|jgi:hypothetical protein|nr:hypothetical protein [Anderseniella sp.]
MENVIDFAARQREAAYKRRKMTEPPAAVVLLTQSGKIAAWATGRGANDDDVLFGDAEDVSWQPYTDAQVLAEKLRKHPAALAIQLAGFSIEAVRI